MATKMTASQQARRDHYVRAELAASQLGRLVRVNAAQVGDDHPVHEWLREARAAANDAFNARTVDMARRHADTARFKLDQAVWSGWVVAPPGTVDGKTLAERKRRGAELAAQWQ